MRTIMKLLSVFALAVAAFSQHTTASANADIWKVQRWSAETILSGSDPSGCISTGMFINLDYSTAGSAGPGDPQAILTLTIYQFDQCTGMIILDVHGIISVPESDFEFAPNLARVTLQTTVPVRGVVPGSSFDVLVDLTWTATSSIQHNNIQYKVGDQDCFTIFQQTTNFRDATVSGTITGGGIDFASGTTPDYATISLTKSRALSTSCE